MKWYGICRPGCANHPFFTFFYVTGSIFNKEAYTVYQAYFYLLVFSQSNRYCFFGDKLGFYCGDQFS